ncbi:MAG: hypothetical protein AAGA23_10370 [Pseudomonadota bacterium]
MKRTLKIVLLSLLLALWVGVVNAMTLSQAVNKVRRDTGGKVLSARTEVRNNREMHVVKVLTKDGKVRTVRVAGNPVKKPRG